MRSHGVSSESRSGRPSSVRPGGRSSLRCGPSVRASRPVGASELFIARHAGGQQPDRQSSTQPASRGCLVLRLVLRRRRFGMTGPPLGSRDSGGQRGAAAHEGCPAPAIGARGQGGRRPRVATRSALDGGSGRGTQRGPTWRRVRATDKAFQCRPRGWGGSALTPYSHPRVSAPDPPRRPSHHRIALSRIRLSRYRTVETRGPFHVTIRRNPSTCPGPIPGRRL